MASIDDMDLNREAGVATDEYEPPSEFFRPPDPGAYSFLRRDKVDTSFSKDKKDLYFQFAAEVQGGAFDGQKVFFFISTTPSQWRKSTTADDYVRACGGVVIAAGKRPLLSEYKESVESNVGPFEAIIRWKGYCQTCDDETVGGKGQPKFPTNDKGELVHETECPECGTKLGARAQLVRFIIP